MKTQIKTESLKSLLSSSIPFCMNKTAAIPALFGGLITLKKNKLKVNTTNLSDAFEDFIEINNSEEMEMAVDVKKMVDFLSLIMDEYINFSIENGKIILEGGGAKGEFGTTEASDFPKQQEIKGEEKLLPKAILNDLLPLVLFTASKDENRPVLTGIRFDKGEGESVIVSTDGFRLSLVKADLDFSDAMTISANVLNHIMRNQGPEGVKYTVSSSDSMVVFEIGSSKIYSRFIAGDYPDYNKVIPDSWETRVVFNREKMLQSLKILSVFGREGASTAIFSVSSDNIVVSPRAQQGDTATTNVEIVSFEGPNLSIAFNFRYIIELLGTIKSDQVVLELSQNTSPGVFKIPGNEKFIHIIMPVRIDE